MAANPLMNLIGGDLPPEIATDAEALQRRQALADLMLKQGMSPLQAPEVKGRFQGRISPFAALGNVAQTMMGTYAQGQASADRAKLAERYGAGERAALADYVRQRDGREVQAPDPGKMTGTMDSEDPPITTQRTVGNPREAVLNAMVSPYLRNNPLIAADMKALQPTTVGRSVMIPATGQVIGTDPAVAAQAAAAQERVNTQQQGATTRNTANNDARQLITQLNITRDMYKIGQNNEAAMNRLNANNAAAQTRVETQQTGANARAANALAAKPNPIAVAREKEDLKLAAALPQARLRVSIVDQNINRLDAALDALDKDPGLARITGTLMGRTPNVSNTATGAQAQLNSIKSQIFVSALQAMREASKTGGAVGNVSNREGDKLEATLGALDQAQNTADFKKQVGIIRRQLQESRTAIQNAFTEQYGGIDLKTPRNFASEQEASAAGLKKGQRVIINGVSGTWE